MTHRQIPFAGLSNALNGMLLMPPLLGWLVVTGAIPIDPQYRVGVRHHDVHVQDGTCLTPGCTLLDRIQAEQHALRQTLKGLS